MFSLRRRNSQQWGELHSKGGIIYVILCALQWDGGMTIEWWEDCIRLNSHKINFPKM